MVQLDGFKALIEIVVSLVMIWFAFLAIQGLQLERLFRRPPRTLPLLIVLLSTAIGFTCAQFLISFITAVNNLTDLIH